ncbi:hypothetical protein [Parvibaculum sp.]|uniref:hypothetical protein n=1 Tax=Parvibaculum sp. TaxID=2024848 RepID=UPI0032EAEC14
MPGGTGEARAEETATQAGAARMTVRRMGFAYPPAMSGHWNRKRPEFSQIVNAASLAMPYLDTAFEKSARRAHARESPKRG